MEVSVRPAASSGLTRRLGRTAWRPHPEEERVATGGQKTAAPGSITAPPPGGEARLSRVEVVFEVAGQPYPLDERAATLMAENLRVKAAHEPGAEGAAGARPIADAIELRLIEDRDDPITLGGDGAEAVYYALRVPNGGSDQLRALYHALKQLRDELGRKS